MMLAIKFYLPGSDVKKVEKILQSGFALKHPSLNEFYVGKNGTSGA